MPEKNHQIFLLNMEKTSKESIIFGLNKMFRVSSMKVFCISFERKQDCSDGVVVSSFGTMSPLYCFNITKKNMNVWCNKFYESHILIPHFPLHSVIIIIIIIILYTYLYRHYAVHIVISIEHSQSDFPKLLFTQDQ